MGSKKSSVLNAALGVLVVFNIILLIMILFKTNAKKIEISRIPSRNPIIQDVSFIDRTCPEVTAKAIDGTNINLREWVGKVIIIRFSKFFRTDISDLSYLEHIKNTFSEKGLVLLFVNSLGNSDFISINEIYRFSSPITIDHEGDISALFNASSDDIVIVDKNFKIKMKTNARGLPDKAIIYHELLSLLFPGKETYRPPNDSELISALKKAEYVDAFSGNVHSLASQLKKITVLAIFTSTCTGCNESSRIRLLKTLADDLRGENVNILIMFGSDNNAAEIRKFALLNNWNKAPIAVGVFHLNREFNSTIYRQLFEFDTDPRLLLLDDKLKILFKENIANANRISKDFLLGKIR